MNKTKIIIVAAVAILIIILIAAGSWFFGGGKKISISEMLEKSRQSRNFKVIQTNVPAPGESTLIWFKDGRMKSENRFAVSYIDLATKKNCMGIKQPDLEGKLSCVKLTSEQIEFLETGNIFQLPLDAAWQKKDNLENQEINLFKSENADFVSNYWVSAENGFPLKVEWFNKKSQETTGSELKEMIFNDVTDQDVAIPANMKVEDAPAENQ
jgi:hypothetical protein